MTTTNVFSGNFTDKPSSRYIVFSLTKLLLAAFVFSKNIYLFRVLRPPGGGSSNIFGGPEEVKKPVKKVENNIFGSPQEVNKVQENVENTKNKEEESSVKKDKLAEDTSQKQPSFKPKLQGF